MNLYFQFDQEPDTKREAIMPPNLLLAYNIALETQRKWIVSSLLIGMLMLILYAITSSIIFALLAIVCVGMWIFWTLWDKPYAIEVYTCIMTEPFPNYIEGIVTNIKRILQPESLRVLFLSKREKKILESTLSTAELLLEMIEQLDDSSFSLDDDLKYVQKNVKYIKHFTIIKEREDGKKKK